VDDFPPVLQGYRAGEVLRRNGVRTVGGSERRADPQECLVLHPLHDMAFHSQLGFAYLEFLEMLDGEVKRHLAAVAYCVAGTRHEWKWSVNLFEVRADHTAIDPAQALPLPGDRPLLPTRSVLVLEPLAKYVAAVLLNCPLGPGLETVYE
jgi:hypothetical protein